ncbi:MAG: hypothetical protein PVH49_14480, partial [Syntrophobacterales bacterium]
WGSTVPPSGVRSSASESSPDDIVLSQDQFGSKPGLSRLFPSPLPARASHWQAGVEGEGNTGAGEFHLRIAS